MDKFMKSLDFDSDTLGNYEWKAQPMVLRTPKSKGLRQLSCRYNDL